VCEFLAGPDLRRPSRPPATQGTEGVIVLNIGSYGGGSDLWGSIAESDTSVEPVQPEGDATSTADGGEFSRDEDGELMAAMATEAAAVGGEAAADCESLGPSPSPRSEPSRERVRRESFDGMFASPSMADELLEVVAVQGVLHMGLALMSLGGARRLCQCRHLTISSQQGLPIQVDGEPFEFEPLFAPRRGLSISVRHLNQAVMLSRSKVRSDGVALEALDWAMQEGVITVEQRNCVLREVARRTGDLQRRKSGLGGLSSSRSFHAVNDFLASG
jgi:diacylglycerol kinase (ATP)